MAINSIGLVLLVLRNWTHTRMMQLGTHFKQVGVCKQHFEFWVLLGCEAHVVVLGIICHQSISLSPPTLVDHLSFK